MRSSSYDMNLVSIRIMIHNPEIITQEATLKIKMMEPA